MKENWVFCCVGNCCVLDSSSTPPHSVLILEEIELVLPLLETLVGYHYLLTLKDPKSFSFHLQVAIINSLFRFNLVEEHLAELQNHDYRGQYRRSGELNFSQSIIWHSLFVFPVINNPWINCQSLTLISAKHSPGIWHPLSWAGLPSHIQLGPSHHSMLTDNSSGWRPLDGISAGLFLPEQCIQESGGISFLISFIWFWTKGFPVLSVPVIQQRTTIESVKQHGDDNCNSLSRLCVILVSSWTKRRADRSSSWGNVSFWRGDTRVLVVTNLMRSQILFQPTRRWRQHMPWGRHCKTHKVCNRQVAQEHH